MQENILQYGKATYDTLGVTLLVGKQLELAVLL